MKKIVSVLLAVLAVFTATAFSGCGRPRSELLRIYNWEDYMDDSLYEAFETWYKEETGKTVHIEVAGFDENETAYSQIKTRKQDYDLFCPSDYMVDRMRKDGMLLPLDQDIVTLEGVILPEVLESARQFDPDNAYAVPYMWGTVGVMYNTDHIDYGSVDSWDALFTDAYSSAADKRIYMKRSLHDTYSIAAVYAAKDELSTLSAGFTDYTADYKTRLQVVLNAASDAAIAAAKTPLLDQNPRVYQYESDNAKFEMAQNQSSAGHLGLFWSCDAGYVMNDYEAPNGDIVPGSRNVWYAVPKEGSNVYLDAFVIPKYAKNTEAANYFLKFINLKENASLNMEYAGATSPVIEAYDEYKAELSASAIDEEDGFFNIPGKDDTFKTAFKQMYIDMMFPPEEVLERCAVMTDFGDREAHIRQMLISVGIPA